MGENGESIPIQENGEDFWCSLQGVHHHAKPYCGTVAEVPKATALGTQASAISAP